MNETKNSETKVLNRDELSKIISQKCKVGEKIVKRVLRTTMATVGQAVEEGGRTRIQGLGTFTRSAAKEDGKVRIRFKPQAKVKGKGKGAGKEAGAEDAD